MPGTTTFKFTKTFSRGSGNPKCSKCARTVRWNTQIWPLGISPHSVRGHSYPFRVKHLLIDEMQDYSPIQYKIIQKLYPCRKTILGDACQSVNPYGSSTADMIQKAFVTGEVMKLCKSYRSTFEITSFAQRIQTNEELEAITRHGEEPTVLSFKNSEEELSAISELIVTFRTSTYKSLGIICKNRDASTRNHRETQIVHGQPLFPIPSEYGFRQRNHCHLIPHGKGVGIRRGDHSASERHQLQHAYRQKYALRCRDKSHAQTNHHALGQTQSIYSLDQSLHTSIHPGTGTILQFFDR